MVAGWKVVSGLAAAAMLAAVALSGCSETLPLANLPDITKLPDGVLNKDQQQRAMNQMIEKGQAQQVEAAKQIEKGK